MKPVAKSRLTTYLILLFLLFNGALLFAQDDSLQFIYLANVNAGYENCRCGDNPLGGLDRIARLIENYRHKNSQTVLIDGGDFLNSYPYQELNALIVDIYKKLKPDILLPADQELQAGNEKIVQLLQNAKFNFVASNFSFSPLTSKEIHYIWAQKTKIAVLTFLDRSSFLYLKPQAVFSFNSEQFKTIYQQALATSDFLITVFHGEDSALNEFIKKFPGVDLILLAHSQSLNDALSSHPIIIGAGADGEYLSVFTLYFQAGRFRKISCQKLPVSLQITPEKQIEKLIQKFKASQAHTN